MLGKSLAEEPWIVQSVDKRLNFRRCVLLATRLDIEATRRHSNSWFSLPSRRRQWNTVQLDSAHPPRTGAVRWTSGCSNRTRTARWSNSLFPERLKDHCFTTRLPDTNTIG